MTLAVARPISAVPTRTHVEPCLTATSRSPDIPADRPVACGWLRMYPAVFDGQPRERLIRIGAQRRDAHQAEQGQSRRRRPPERTDASTAGGIVDVDTAARDVAVEADLDVDAAADRSARRRRSARAAARSKRRHHPGGAHRMHRMRPARRSIGPCCAGSDRPCASAIPRAAASGTSAATAATFADASCSRDSPKARQPRLDKMATSVAGKNFVMGSSSISVALRPTASAARANRVTQLCQSGHQCDFDGACEPLCAPVIPSTPPMRVGRSARPGGG